MADVAKLFDRLFDDASVFPPGNAPLPAAIVDHTGHRRSWYASTVGPLVVPAARIEEVAALVETSFELALTGRLDDPDLDQYLAEASEHPQLKVRALELVVASGPGGSSADDCIRAAARRVASLDSSAEVFIEDPDHSSAVLDRMAAEPTRLVVKLRTGGVVASAFPSETQLGAWIASCTERGLRFKCTAGLHHAVRHTESETGFEHHGFLNVILALRAALDGAPAIDLATALSVRDQATVVEEVSRIAPSSVEEIRDRFVSFGTCSVTAPVEDLVAFGLLVPPP